MTSHTTHNQQRPPGLQTLPLFSKPSGPHSLGEPSTWPQVSYSSQVCLRSIALAWYARILSTVLAFYFSNSCYFTFKVGHHWRTEHLFCIQISSDGGWVVSISPPGSRCLCVYESVNAWTILKKKRKPGLCSCLYHMISVFQKAAQPFKTKHARTPSPFPSWNNPLHGSTLHFLPSTLSPQPIFSVHSHPLL